MGSPCKPVFDAVDQAARRGYFALNFRGATYVERVTVLEVIQRSTDFLAKKGVESPRLQIEWILAHLLHVPRLNLYLNFERPLTEEELASARSMVSRRGNREPVQRILGSTSFCGLEIKVNQHVLIPRPETELLAERGWELLRSAARQPAIALDFGTGSGCIAVAMAVNCPGCRIDALDVSCEALEVARENAAHHRVAERIQFFSGDGFSPLPSGSSYDLIISNPPYVPSTEIDSLAPEVRDHDPRRALDGGPDGLNFYRRFASEARERLPDGGRILLELGDGQAERVRELFVQYNWIVESVEADYAARARILTARR